jgi:hypothetical protein
VSDKDALFALLGKLRASVEDSNGETVRAA